MAVRADRVGDLGVAAVFLARGLQQRCRRLVGNAAVVPIAIEAADDRHRHCIPPLAQQDDARRRGIDAGQGCQPQGQDLAARDAAAVAHARELPDGQPAIRIDHRALGTHAAQRGSLALQVAQILGGFLATLDRATGLVDLLELNQGGRAAPPMVSRALPDAVVSAQAQRADTAEVVHRQQVVQLGERWQMGGRLAPLGMVAGDHTTAPGVRSGVGDRAVEDGVMGRRRLVRLVTRDEL